MLTDKALDFLVCPLGKSTLRIDGSALVCERCGPRFRISPQGFANMIMEEAELPAGCRSLEQLPCMKDRTHPGSPSHRA